MCRRWKSGEANIAGFSSAMPTRIELRAEAGASSASARAARTQMRGLRVTGTGPFGRGVVRFYNPDGAERMRAARSAGRRGAVQAHASRLRAAVGGIDLDEIGGRGREGRR